jgi:hypothetical protein
MIHYSLNAVLYIMVPCLSRLRGFLYTFIQSFKLPFISSKVYDLVYVTFQRYIYLTTQIHKIWASI